MKNIIISNDPELKADFRGINRETIDTAYTCDGGIALLNNNDRYDELYLDYEFLQGDGREVLTWLSDNLDKVPELIVPISISPKYTLLMYQMIHALQVTARKHRESQCQNSESMEK